MILRHITLKKHLKSIVEMDCLLPTNQPRRSDHGYISFEKYNGNDYLLKPFVIEKKVELEDVFPLLFDGEKIMNDGINIVDLFENGGKMTKEELNPQFFESPLTMIEFAQIGDYRFIKGTLSLKYLLPESKEALTKMMNELK